MDQKRRWVLVLVFVGLVGFILAEPYLKPKNPDQALSPEDAEMTSLDYDFRKRGFRIEMDSRIAVDGKRICFRYADRGAPNRCAAIQNCQDTALKDLEKRFRASKDTNPDQAVQDLVDKAYILAFKEKTLVEAEKAFETAYQYAQKHGHARALEILAMKGVVQLRLGEITNCIKNHNGDSCIFPLSERARHIDKNGSRAALATFYKYLEAVPNDDHIQWLVNILHMTLGTYPNEVPAKYLVPLDKIAAEKAFPAFQNVTDEIGIREQANFGGVAVDDFNGDGYPDIIFGSLNQCESVKYFQYDPKQHLFVNRTKEAGLATQLGAGLVLSADYDNDGDLDLFITRGAWHPGGGDYPTQGGFVYNTLMENVGGGKFVDRTVELGLRTTPNSTLSANWGDIDSDGLLDLFVSNESSDSEIFLNRKTHFENFTKQSGVVNRAIGKGSILADLDNDGNLDLIFSNYAGPNRIFYGDGSGRFKLSEKQPLIKAPEYGFPTAVFDYDNDGYQDIFFAAFAPDIDNFAKWLKGLPNKGEIQRMYRNNGKRVFEDVSQKVHLDKMSLVMSVNFGDVDNDGFKDIYVGTGANSLGDLEPNHLYVNSSEGRFYNVTSNARVGSLQKGHGISFADLDGDGFSEIVLQQGGSSHGDRYFPAVFKNPGFADNRYVQIELLGTKANRRGLHSRLIATVKMEDGRVAKFYNWHGASGSFGTNPSTSTIGLGKAKELLSLEIEWQGSGTRQTVRDLALNKRYRITEGQAKPEELEIATVPLTGSSSTDSHKGHGVH